MKAIKVLIPLALVTVIALAIAINNYSHSPGPVSAAPQATVEPTAMAPESPVITRTEKASINQDPIPDIAPVEAPKNTTKLDRLFQTQELFRQLAAGDRVSAMRAAKQITNEVERETALFTLVTEWTHGELGSPRQRASRISTYGVEAGLGFELANQPGLALTWANELTGGSARIDLLQEVARGMVRSDPSAAFALSEQAPQAERRKFFDSLLADWAAHDTEAALKWIEQFPDPADREATLKTIQGVAPVGIGAALGVLEGHPVIGGLVPGTPAAISGQLAPGDRILAVAQGNGMFVDVQNLPLANVANLLRGAAGTPVQLQVIAADAPNSPPRTVTLYRDQIKFKN
jgi:hypothetical protein